MGHTLEVVFTAVFEFDARSGDEVDDRTRYQHLARARHRRHPVADMDPDASDVRATHFNFTGVNPGSNV